MTCIRHSLSSQNSRERKIWPARLRFACYRQHRGRWASITPDSAAQAGVAIFRLLRRQSNAQVARKAIFLHLQVLQDLAIRVVRLALHAGSPDRSWANRRKRKGPAPLSNPFCIWPGPRGQRAPRRPDKREQLDAAAQGKPVKTLSPNGRGGSFTGRRQTAATPHAPPSERVAGNRTEPAEVPPPHIYEGLTVHAAGSEHPNGTGIGAGHVPRFGPGSVQVSGSASAPASAPAGRSLQERESTLGPTRAHSGPQTVERTNVNGIAGPGAFYYSGRIPAAGRRRRPDRITRSYTKCKPAEPRPVCTGAPARVGPWAVRALLFV